MLRLLNLEFHKLKASRVFKIFTIAYFLILLGVAVVATLEFELGNGFSFKMADQHIFETPLLWHMNAYLASILKLILAFINDGVLVGVRVGVGVGEGHAHSGVPHIPEIQFAAGTK